MKVFIITEGSQKIGFGHLARCSAIHEAFEERDICPEFIVNGDDAINNLMKDKRYKIVNWLKQQDALFSRIRGADIVVLDSYMAPAGFYDAISSIVNTTVHIDDTKRIRYLRGIVLNGAIGAEKLRYPKIKGVDYLLGIRYTPLRADFKHIQKKSIKKNVKNVLIIFGGNDSKSMIPKFLKFLNTFYADFINTIVVNKNFKNIKEIEGLVSENNNLIYSPGSKEMKDLMFEADIAISAGGQTLYELARMGVPTISVAIAKNQLNNIKEWSKVGFINYIGWYNGNELLSRLALSIKRLSSRDVRLKISNLSRNLIDGKGASRVASFLIDRASLHKDITLRQTNLKDSKAFWLWRNHPEVRKWSYDKNYIEYERHKKWFASKLNDKNVSIYTALNNRNERIGQVRFEKNGKGTAYINVNLNPNFFGKGLGGHIITKATRSFMYENSSVKNIYAEIISGNIASEKAFEKAGYEFCRMSNGVKRYVY